MAAKMMPTADLHSFCRHCSAEYLPSVAADIQAFRLKGSTLILELRCETVMPFEEICRLEQAIEKACQIPEVILRQERTQLTEKPFCQPSLDGAENWIRRHASRLDSFECRLFCGGRLSEQEGQLHWLLPQGVKDVLAAREFVWLEHFWNSYAPLPAAIVYLEEKGQKKSIVAKKTGVGSRPQRMTADTIPARRAENAAPCVDSRQPAPAGKKKPRERAAAEKGDLLWGRKRAKDQILIPLAELGPESGRATLRGQVLNFEKILTKSGKLCVKFTLADETMAISCVLWPKEEECRLLEEKLPAAWVEMTADVTWDERFSKDYQARVSGLSLIETPSKRQDYAETKRVELHMHSKFSAKDATSSPTEIVRRAADFGHEAVAITDHGVVQAFPEAAAEQLRLARNGKAIKLIYGMEGYLVDDGPALLFAADEVSMREAKGLAVLLLWEKREENKALCLGRRWPHFPEKLAVFEDLSLDFDCRPAEELNRESWEHRLSELKRLQIWLGDSLLSGGESPRSLSLLRDWGFQTLERRPQIKFNPPLLDAEALADYLGEENPFANWRELSRDEALDQIDKSGARILSFLQKSGAGNFYELNQTYGWRPFDRLRQKDVRRRHIILLASTRLGLYHLYRLVSLSNLEYFYKKPCLPRSALSYFRQGLILGSACVEGEVFASVVEHYRRCENDEARALAEISDRTLCRTADFYDYLEIQALANNRFLLAKEGSGIRTEADLKSLNRLVIALAEKIGKPVAATCDAHFVEESQGIYRRILMSDMGFEEEVDPAPLFFRNTEEMLGEFAWLGEETARRVVVDSPRSIAARIADGLLPIPEGNYPPVIADAERAVREIAEEEARRVYGRDGRLPETISKRLERELDAIINNGYAVMYFIAQALVKKSNDDGYIVGSRGSVGSSLVATLCGITEVNPLTPHYRCPRCHYFEESPAGVYGSGYDLPEKSCPDCGERLIGDGQDIPFETFMGFEGNKQPDIDLNFSGDYQPRAHAFIEEMFGSRHTFRAGTISTFKEAKSQALVWHYFDDKAMTVGRSRIGQLAAGIEGVKTSTGQHPGGIIVVPKDREIYDFTPIQHPAEKKDSGVTTTHFDFHALHDSILKLDVLGHVDPTMLKMLGDLTNIRVADIPLPDANVLSLFWSTEALGIPAEKSATGCGTLGLPEVGTKMAREMIRETKPANFYDLMQISGLSHGTMVWKDNAQDLIRKGICKIDEVIGLRDSIMTKLIYDGLPYDTAFAIMEAVRKGKGLTEEQERLMREKGIPAWYIDSCCKIKYLFPKAHAAAYMISTLRIGWFKVYHPEAYYASWFSMKRDEFSAEEFLLPAEMVSARRYEQWRRFAQLETREEKKFYVLEVVEEMQERGIDFLPLDLSLSPAARFAVEGKGRIRPPLNSIPGISTALAEQICQARDAGPPFLSRDELKQRAGLGEAAMQSLAQFAVLDDLPESNQIDLQSWRPDLLA